MIKDDNSENADRRSFCCNPFFSDTDLAFTEKQDGIALCVAVVCLRDFHACAGSFSQAFRQIC